jgi:hypothetical protein
MKRLLLLLVVVSMGFAACTANERTKLLGGTQTIVLDPGLKLENITWKETELWLLTRRARPGEVPERHEFMEKSPFGILEGTVVIQER